MLTSGYLTLCIFVFFNESMDCVKKKITCRYVENFSFQHTKDMNFLEKVKKSSTEITYLFAKVVGQEVLFRGR